MSNESLDKSNELKNMKSLIMKDSAIIEVLEKISRFVLSLVEVISVLILK